MRLESFGQMISADLVKTKLLREVHSTKRSGQKNPFFAKGKKKKNSDQRNSDASMRKDILRTSILRSLLHVLNKPIVKQKRKSPQHFCSDKIRKGK